MYVSVYRRVNMYSNKVVNKFYCNFFVFFCLLLLLRVICIQLRLQVCRVFHVLAIFSTFFILTVYLHISPCVRAYHTFALIKSDWFYGYYYCCNLFICIQTCFAYGKWTTVNADVCLYVCICATYNGVLMEKRIRFRVNIFDTRMLRPTVYICILL